MYIFYWILLKLQPLIKFFKIYFNFGCPESLLLGRFFSSCGDGGYSLVVAHGLLIPVSSLVAEDGP